MARRPSARSISRLRSYAVEEVARKLGVHRNTVRRWLKIGLATIDGKKPFLIHGGDLTTFLNGRKPKRHKLQPSEGYCLKCREPREPAFGEVEVTVTPVGRLSYVALCETCSTVMHKALGRGLLPALRAKCTVTIRHDPGRIYETADPCPNVHSREETADHGKAPSEE